ncbi:MAG: imidazole glycerol phosphate synthase subunit HisH, partial [Verrucomicrobia bacterium]|nr:imidazole glycerol phosphate synthase subunit HisH [Verrucomicrobiota bacterium]
MKQTPIIGILDYRIGNLSNVKRAFQKTGIGQVKIVKRPDQISKVDVLVIPGVGSFGDGMKELFNKNMVQSIQKVSRNKKKILIGICLGLQLFGMRSEEAPGTKGLGLLPFTTKKIPSKQDFPVPHMGWNSVWYRGKKLF